MAVWVNGWDKKQQPQDQPPMQSGNQNDQSGNQGGVTNLCWPPPRCAGGGRCQQNSGPENNQRNQYDQAPANNQENQYNRAPANNQQRQYDQSANQGGVTNLCWPPLPGCRNPGRNQQNQYDQAPQNAQNQGQPDPLAYAKMYGAN